MPKMRCSVSDPPKHTAAQTEEAAKSLRKALKQAQGKALLTLSQDYVLKPQTIRHSCTGLLVHLAIRADPVQFTEPGTVVP